MLQPEAFSLSLPPSCNHSAVKPTSLQCGLSLSSIQRLYTLCKFISCWITNHECVQERNTGGVFMGEGRGLQLFSLVLRLLTKNHHRWKHRHQSCWNRWSDSWEQNCTAHVFLSFPLCRPTKADIQANQICVWCSAEWKKHWKKIVWRPPIRREKAVGCGSLTNKRLVLNYKHTAVQCWLI